MNKNRLYGVLFVQEEHPDHMDTVGVLKVKTYLPADPELNPYNIRCYWSRRRYPERGKMYDLDLNLNVEDVNTTRFKERENYLAFCYDVIIPDPTLVDILPSKVDMRPFRSWRVNQRVMGWINEDLVNHNALSTPNSVNHLNYVEYCKEQDTEPKPKPTLIQYSVVQEMLLKNRRKENKNA